MITQIGTRLVKTISKGESLVKVVTETVNGKTYTRVLDSKGRVLRNRVKQISKFQVGDKKVSEITKVTGFNDGDFGTQLEKTIYNRVYNTDGNLLGTRTQFFENCLHQGKWNDKLFHTATSKQGTDNYRFIKQFNANTGKVSNKCTLYYGKGSPHFNIKTSYGLQYNDLGLPYPKDYIGPKNSSLKEMRNWHILNHPERPYADTFYRLDFLNNRLENQPTINSLDQFI